MKKKVEPKFSIHHWAIVSSYALVIILTAAVPEASCAILYSVTDLGTLGGSISDAYGINDIGQVVGSAYTASGEQHAFLYSGGVMLDLLRTSSRAYGINNSGQIVGYADHAFLYSGGVRTDFGAVGSTAQGINNNAQIVGWSYTNSVTYIYSFLYGGGIMTDLGTLDGHDSYGRSYYARAINDKGQIVGGVGPSSPNAFLYSGGKMTALGNLDPSFRFESAFGINDSGQIVGFGQTNYPTGHERAVLYSAGDMTDLGTLGGQYSYAWAINDNGQVVGTAATASAAHAFLYSGGIMTDLNTFIDPSSGWMLESASAINNNAWIVGTGTNSLGQHHAFLLKPLPPGPIQGRLVVSPSLVPADGTSAATVTVRLRDAKGNPLVGKTIRISAAEIQGSGLATTLLSVSQPATQTDVSGTATATVTSYLPGIAIISALDETDSLPLAQQPTIQFTSALVQPNVALSQAIGMFSRIVGQDLNDSSLSFSAVGVDAGTYGDRFRAAFSQDKAEGVLDAIIGIAGIFTAGADTLEAAQLLELPGVAETGVGPLIKDSAHVSYFLDTELMRGSIPTVRVLESAAWQVVKTAIPYAASLGLDEGLKLVAAEPSGLSSVGKNIARNCLLYQSSLDQHAQILLNAGIPPLTAAQQTAWANDLQARYSVGSAMLGVVEQEDKFVHQYASARQQSSQNALEWLLVKFAIEAGATVFFDGPGALIVGGGFTIAGELQTLQRMNADQTGYDAAFSVLGGCVQYSAQDYLNASSAYTEISQGHPANPINAQLGQMVDWEDGYSAWRPRHFASDFIVTKAYSVLDVKNASSDSITVQVIVLSGYASSAYGVALPHLSRISAAAQTIPAMTDAQISVTYYDGQNGGKPDPSTPMRVYILGNNRSGTFYIGSLSHSWNPTTTPAPGLSVPMVPQKQLRPRSDGTLDTENPVASYVTQDSTNQTYLARIFVANPFPEAYSAIITQALPAGLTVLTTDGTMADSSIFWSNSLPPGGLAKDTFTFSLAAPPGASTNIPPPVATFVDSTNNQGTILTSVKPGFIGLLPVQVNSLIPMGMLGTDVPMQVVITNLSAINQTGSITIALTNSDATFGTNLSQAFFLTSLDSKVLIFDLPTALQPSTYSLTAVLNINGGHAQVLSGVYNVPLPPVSLTISSMVGRNTNGLNLLLQGPVGSNYLIEASADLQTWSPVKYVSATTSPFYFTEITPTNSMALFYRAVMP